MEELIEVPGDMGHIMYVVTTCAERGVRVILSNFAAIGTSQGSFTGEVFLCAINENDKAGNGFDLFNLSYDTECCEVHRSEGESTSAHSSTDIFLVLSKSSTSGSPLSLSFSQWSALESWKAVIFMLIKKLSQYKIIRQIGLATTTLEKLGNLLVDSLHESAKVSAIVTSDAVTEPETLLRSLCISLSDIHSIAGNELRGIHAELENLVGFDDIDASETQQVVLPASIPFRFNNDSGVVNDTMLSLIEPEFSTSLAIGYDCTCQPRADIVPIPCNPRDERTCLIVEEPNAVQSLLRRHSIESNEDIFHSPNIFEISDQSISVSVTDEDLNESIGSASTPSISSGASSARFSKVGVVRTESPFAFDEWQDWESVAYEDFFPAMVNQESRKKTLPSIVANSCEDAQPLDASQKFSSIIAGESLTGEPSISEAQESKEWGEINIPIDQVDVVRQPFSLISYVLAGSSLPKSATAICTYGLLHLVTLITALIICCASLGNSSTRSVQNQILSALPPPMLRGGESVVLGKNLALPRFVSFENADSRGSSLRKWHWSLPDWIWANKAKNITVEYSTAIILYEFDQARSSHENYSFSWLLLLNDLFPDRLTSYIYHRIAAAQALSNQYRCCRISYSPNLTDSNDSSLLAQWKASPPSFPDEPRWLAYYPVEWDVNIRLWFNQIRSVLSQLVASMYSYVSQTIM